MMLTRIGRWIFPAAIFPLLNSLIKGSKWYRKRHQRSLIESNSDTKEHLSNEWAVFRDAVADAMILLEFGSGQSTLFVSDNYQCKVRSIETDEDWALALRARKLPQVEIIHVNLGPTGKWGRPLSYERRNSFETYWKVGFEGGFTPDVVLIDGRFRIACFCFTLLHTKPGTKIVFDDYVDRPPYHVVEELVHPTAVSSKQALFIRPVSLDDALAQAMLRQFAMVMD